MPWNTGIQGIPLNIAAYPGTQLRVVAGPGTGKTFALMRLRSHSHPDPVAALPVTNSVTVPLI